MTEGGGVGRANEAFPPVWLSLRPPSDPSSATELMEAALDARTVLDLTCSPAFWGPRLGGGPVRTFAYGDAGLAAAPSAEAAGAAVAANLVELLSSLGRSQLDFYALRCREPIGEAQLDGAFAALEDARREGLVRFVVLAAEVEPGPAERLLAPHDAFELLAVPADDPRFDGLRAEAAARRLDVVEVERAPGSPAIRRAGARLVPVASAAEVRGACRAPAGAR